MSATHGSSMSANDAACTSGEYMCIVHVPLACRRTTVLADSPAADYRYIPVHGRADHKFHRRRREITRR